MVRRLAPPPPITHCLSHPTVEPPPWEYPVRRPAGFAARCLLSLALCVAGCQTGPGQPTIPPTPVGLKITAAKVDATGVQPGQPVACQVRVWVGPPPGQNVLPVTVRLRPLFHQQPLPAHVDPRVLPRDYSHHTFTYPLPLHAAEGSYVMEIVIMEARPAPGRPPVTERTTTGFVVGPATPR